MRNPNSMYGIALALTCGLVASMEAQILYVGNYGNGTVGEYTTSGATVNASLISGLAGPSGIAILGNDLFIANAANGIVGEYTTTGATVNASLISVSYPQDVATVGNDLLIGGQFSGAIGEYATNGATVNASLISGLSVPVGIAISGNDIFVANYHTGIVGEYTTSGATVNASLISGLTNPTCIAISGNDLFVANSGNGTIGEYSTNGSTVNASLISGLNHPQGIAISGNDIFVANYLGGTVGEYTTSGAMVNASLISGLNEPWAIAIDSEPTPATAVATITNGFCVAAKITNPGWGYTNTPLVLIEGGGGQGATGAAVVSNEMVTAITIIDAGSGYAGTPTIYIGLPPIITVQPQSLAVDGYSPATFSVTASGTVPLGIPFYYQWYSNGAMIPGATFSALTISSVTQTNLGTYAVIVSNVFGSITSSNAVLSMYPYLVEPFGGGETYWGYTNTLSVGAWGTGPLTYQWFDNGVAIEDATNASLTFSGIQLTNAGLYTVVVTSPLGSVTNTPEQLVVNPSGISIGLSPTVTITGVVGYNYTIERTSDLADTNSWLTMTNLTLTQPAEIWTDTSINTALPGNPRQFYRIVPGQ